MSGRALLLAAVLTSRAALAFCPCYTLSSTNNTLDCGVEAVAGTNPTTQQWQSIFALVAQGPSVWGAAGPSVPDLGDGCGKPQPTRQVPAKFPCEILKAIAMQESGWRQFCAADTPADQVGNPSRTIISFDCGYGIGQVTSGMHRGETPTFDRLKVASDPTYNLATGTRILGDKWRATNCVGDNRLHIVEDWYTAVWAYNGLAYKNNPSNPVYSSARGSWNPQVGGNAPYQEHVFGWIERPPTPQHWEAVAVAYPDPTLVGSSGAPPALPEPSCASPTNCVATRPVHTSLCFSQVTDGGTSTDAGADAGRPDAGRADGGRADAGRSDGGRTDAGGGIPTVLPNLDGVQGEAVGGCGCGSGGPGVPALALFAALVAGWNARRRRGHP